MTTITIDRATVEQALEVLLKSHTCPLLPDDCEEAITALRAGLAQQAEPVQEICPGCEATLGAACGRESCPKGWEAAPQPQQAEPVKPAAWFYQNMYTEQEYLVWKKGTGGRNWRPLYTAPPQRKPLPTHDQHCVNVLGYGLMAVRLVRAVERAHGIGEGA